MKHILTVLKALSDRNRLRIMAALTNYNELCACQITELLQVTPATASRHLSILTAAGLTENRKEGRWVYYRISPKSNSLKNVNELMEWIESEFAASDDVANDMKTMKVIIKLGRKDLCRKQRGTSCCPV